MNPRFVQFCKGQVKQGGFDRLYAQVVDYPECYGENWSALAARCGGKSLTFNTIASAAPAMMASQTKDESKLSITLCLNTLAAAFVHLFKQKEGKSQSES